LQIGLNEDATSVLKDGKEMKFNKKNNFYELKFTLKEGVHKYKIVATDLHGNVSEKTVSVDGICRTDSYLGLVHPYCFQYALLHCQPQSQGACVTNYVNTRCGKYH